MPKDEKLHILFLSSWYPNQEAPLDGNKIQTYAREHFSFQAVGQQYMDLYSQMLKPLPCSKK